MHLKASAIKKYKGTWRISYQLLYFAYILSQKVNTIWVKTLNIKKNNKIAGRKIPL